MFERLKAIAYTKQLVAEYNQIAARVDSERGRLATLLAGELALADGEDNRERAWELAGCLADRIVAIEFLVFLRAKGLADRDHAAEGLNAIKELIDSYGGFVDAQTLSLQETNLVEFRKATDGSYRRMTEIAIQKGTIRFE